MTNPPIKPTKSAMMVSSGKTTAVAIRRGVTNFWIGSVPRARIASICSVTFIEPSSLAIPDAFRPATSSELKHWPQFANQRDSNNLTNLARSSVRRQSLRHLHRHHGSAEEARKYDNRETADADNIHLQDNVAAVMRAEDNILHRPASQDIEILQGQYGAFDQIAQTSRCLV